MNEKEIVARRQETTIDRVFWHCITFIFLIVDTAFKSKKFFWCATEVWLVNLKWVHVWLNWWLNITIDVHLRSNKPQKSEGDIDLYAINSQQTVVKHIFF
jgi:hypothetical protein